MEKNEKKLEFTLKIVYKTIADFFLFYLSNVTRAYNSNIHNVMCNSLVNKYKNKANNDMHGIPLFTIRKFYTF